MLLQLERVEFTCRIRKSACCIELCAVIDIQIKALCWLKSHVTTTSESRTRTRFESRSARAVPSIIKIKSWTFQSVVRSLLMERERFPVPFWAAAAAAIFKLQFRSNLIGFDTLTELREKEKKSVKESLKPIFFAEFYWSALDNFHCLLLSPPPPCLVCSEYWNKMKFHSPLTPNELDYCIIEPPSACWRETGWLEKIERKCTLQLCLG